MTPAHPETGEVTVTEEQQEAACKAYGCDGVGDLHRTHDWKCEAVGKLIAERDAAAERRGGERVASAITKMCDERDDSADVHCGLRMAENEALAAVEAIRARSKP